MWKAAVLVLRDREIVGMMEAVSAVIVERVVLLATTAVALWMLSGWLSRRKRVLAHADETSCENFYDCDES